MIAAAATMNGGYAAGRSAVNRQRVVLLTKEQFDHLHAAIGDATGIIDYIRRRIAAHIEAQPFPHP